MKNSKDMHKLALEIQAFISNGHVQAWLKQTKTPFCYLKLDPLKKQIIICRWGFKKRPRGTEEVYWKRLTPSGHVMMTKEWEEILGALKWWDCIWDNLIFNRFESENPPDLLPNSRYSNISRPIPLFVNNLGRI